MGWEADSADPAFDQTIIKNKPICQGGRCYDTSPVSSFKQKHFKTNKSAQSYQIAQDIERCLGLS